MKSKVTIVSLILNVVFIKHYKIVMFGDSLTFMGDWPGLLEKRSVKVSGNPGFTTSHFLFIVKEQVLKFSPDTCYIQGGINDIGVGIPLLRTIKNYNTLIDTLEDHKIIPIIQSTLLTTDVDRNRAVDSLNNNLVNICLKKGIRYINLNTSMSVNGKLKKELSLDGTHINKEGYEIWAKAIK